MTARYWMILLLAACLAAAPWRTPAAQPRFDLPVACALPAQCMVQFYVDNRAGPAVGDYRCGTVSYDRHRGTDIRVRTMQDVRKGVKVLAAAAGVVVAVRDGEPDIEVSVLGRDKTSNKGGGNVVVLDHGQGWLSQYWHLRKGSIAVERGQKIKGGTPIGLIGMSGDASFPHLHFEVWRNGSVVDPFTGAAPGASPCGRASQPLWSASALQKLSYDDIALIHAGLSNRTPTRIEVGDGKLVGDTASARKRPINFWYELVGLRRGDTVDLTFKSVDGNILAQRQRQFQRPVSYLFDVVAFDLADRQIEAGRYIVTIAVKSLPEEKDALPFARLMRTLEIDLKP